MAYGREHQAKVELEKDLSTRQDIGRSWMVLEMEKLEEEAHCMLLDVVEVEVVVEMSQTRHLGLGKVMTDDLQEELGKEPGM